MTVRSSGAAPHQAVIEPVLRVDGVTKGFRQGWLRRHRIEVLRGVDLKVEPGELVGLVGENGSGKSVLMKIIVGLLSRGGGEIKLDGRLGYCPQAPLVWDKLTVAEHFKLFGKAYDLGESKTQEATKRLLTELNFDRYADYRVEDLSGGTKQKLNLSIALMHEPALLLLDEPYSGFDWETYLHFWEMAKDRRERGMGILVVSHLLAERERLDRIYSLVDGMIKVE
jgi:ABC-type multidrug transport system ATPase subunit